MAQALYRRFRPQRFAEVVGQPHITTILQEALKQGRVAHAYLFSGPRGSGKTTMARLVAKALNCSKRLKTAEPCLTCASCQAIWSGRALDVIEIDAASNRGIDEVRELKQHIATLPAVLAKKVVIIDEVHMLTREAFNALLKLLEEPPEHVTFILATTEWHKVPKTVISRCQHFAFREASLVQLTQHLLSVAAKESIAITPEAAALIGALADGSFRDALGLLDRLASLKEEITAALVRTHLGLPVYEQVVSIFTACIQGNAASALEELRVIAQSGADPISTYGALTHVVRTFVYLVGVGEKEGVEIGIGLGLAKSDCEKLLGSVGTVTKEQVGELLRALIATERELKIIHEPWIGIDHLVLQWSTAVPVRAKESEEDPQPAPVVEEKKLKEEKEEPSVKQDPAPTPADMGGFEQKWNAFVTQVGEKNAPLGSLLKSAHIEQEGSSKIMIGVAFSFSADRLNEKKAQVLLNQIGESVWGRKMSFAIKLNPAVQQDVPGGDDLLDEINTVFPGV